jgi:hypothetical protein
VRPDSQDVGLEAAIIERVRKSSLVECACTDNVARLKHRTEALESLFPQGGGIGRGALCAAEKPDRKDGWSAHKSECRNE